MGRIQCNRILIIFAATAAAIATVVSAQQNVTRAASSENFYVSDFKHTWLGAVEHCHRIGKRLVVIDSASKQDEIIHLVRNSSVAFNPFQTHIWIGASDLVRQYSFVWHDTGRELGETYTNWQPGEPSGGNEHCTLMWYLPSHNWFWKWNDGTCDDKFFFVCETRPK